MGVLHVCPVAGERRVGPVEVVVVDQPARVRQEMADRDPIAVGDQARQPLLDGVLDPEDPVLVEQRDQRRGPDLAHALQPHACIGRHRRACSDIGQTRGARPGSLRARHVSLPDHR
jgi:hypothetical protein